MSIIGSIIFAPSNVATHLMLNDEIRLSSTDI